MRPIVMSPMDAAWFYAEKRAAPAHFGPLLIARRPDGAPPTFVRDLVDRWRESAVFEPPFNYVLGPGRVSWRTLSHEQVDLTYHFRHSAVPAPGGEHELAALISRLQSRGLDRGRPLWECHVIEGLEGERFAIYLKLHHGQLDGVGGRRISRPRGPGTPATRTDER